MTTDDDSYVCDLCGETFERPSELGGHKRGHQLTVGREEFQAELRRLADEFEQTPTVSMMNEHGAYSSCPATNHFDSWTAALNSIGLSPVQQDKIPAAEVKTDIRAVAREIGHPPTAAEYNERAEYNVSTAQNKFGSWNDALRACGYEPHLEHRVSDESLLDAIDELTTELGKVPTPVEMHEYGRYSLRCYYERWAGWQAAVRTAGHEPVGRPTGPDNYMWKENPAERLDYGPNWDEQRAKALERDDYRCQTPGCPYTQAAHQAEFGTDLQVHHVRPLRTWKDESGEIDFERAHRLENLVTLCLRHHQVWEQFTPLRPNTR